jgi:hypothetical protein
MNRILALLAGVTVLQGAFAHGALGQSVQDDTKLCQSRDGIVELKPPFKHEAGYAYTAEVPQLTDSADTMTEGQRSPYLLCENGKLLRGAHTAHDDIRREGRGGYSHWQKFIYFSASDRSDPNTNGYRYILVRKP